MTGLREPWVDPASIPELAAILRRDWLSKVRIYEGLVRERRPAAAGGQSAGASAGFGSDRGPGFDWFTESSLSACCSLGSPIPRGRPLGWI